MNLGEILRMTYPVSDESVDAMLSAVKLLKVKKRQAIVEQGVRTDSVFFVKNGVFRVTMTIDGREDTILFGCDGDVFASLNALYAGGNSWFSCIAETDSEVFAITFDDFSRLQDEHHDLAFSLRDYLIGNMFAFERRYVNFSLYDASQRYEQFLRMRPELLEHIPLKHLAQYLKVTPETLSRIRAKYVDHT